ncbi:hypothetical protein AB0G60_00680 [Streptomyces angustmyceticus]|uniref:Uncharacterized protein n=1 Tax=Streptomyces angustmyceticus TaxID=285578 RepID=A0A5J4L7Y3_9ACTN|nr:hypothetical protein [Streptomyces angustmyceticus]GES28322.1 hypothetical protein San01_08090 [Streptomyces angustmyceticus]
MAYPHLRGGDRGSCDLAPDVGAIARYRRQFHGPMIANNGFDRESANALIASGHADAVSSATHFIANPDLVTRFALGRELAVGDPDTCYAGGADGHVAYPASRWRDGADAVTPGR